MNGERKKRKNEERRARRRAFRLMTNPVLCGKDLDSRLRGPTFYLTCADAQIEAFLLTRDNAVRIAEAKAEQSAIA